MTTTATKARGRIPARLLGTLIGAAALLGLAGPASALAAPVVEVDSSHNPSTVPAGTYAKFEFTVKNTGDADTTGPTTVDFTVPAGLEVTGVESDTVVLFGPPTDLWSCSTPDSQTASCVGPSADFLGPIPIESGKSEACDSYLILGAIPVSQCRFYVTVKADANTPAGTLVPTVHASGGGSVDFDGTAPIDVGPPPAFGFESFDGATLDRNGDPENLAGARPRTAKTSFLFDSSLDAKGGGYSNGEVRKTAVQLPPGLLGNPTAVPTCSQAEFRTHSGGYKDTCDQLEPDSEVGFVRVLANGALGDGPDPLPYTYSPLYRLDPPVGTTALFGFNFENVPVYISAKVRSGGDYGVTVSSGDINQTLPLAGFELTFWGVTGDPLNDLDRGTSVYGDSCADPEAEAKQAAALPGLDPTCIHSFNGPIKPFITLPTHCSGSPLETSISATTWDGQTASASFLMHDNSDNPLPLSDCAGLQFDPTLSARPTTNVADSPSGLDVDLHVPQNEGVCTDVAGPPATVDCGRATSHLKDATVTLPEGLTVNPSGANGLGACSLSQFGYTTTDPDGTIHTTPDPATCPDQAKVASVEVDTPLLDHPVTGAAYIAAPYSNPFNSLLALYITAHDAQSGVVVKLAGQVHLDPNTGRISATFKQNPQLPFEHFKLNFKSGPHGQLRTPGCGDYTTTSELTPWSGNAPANPQDAWQITQGPGGNCDSPNAPSFDAGTVSPVAASYSHGVITLRRDDGSQQFKSVTITPPPGMLGKLAGIPACSDAGIAQAQGRTNHGDGAAEQADPSCPAASQVGTVDVAAGAGPAPYNTTGKVYMAGPYQGAPLSFVIITPAVAGPFDLGVVTVRTALHIDPVTAQITAVTDNIPSILDGIPLDVRTAAIKLDRDQFIRTGTNCDPQAFSGSLVSTLSQSAALSERFQLAECTGLAFKPHLKLRLRGGHFRNGHPAFTSVLAASDGQANLGKVQVTLPPTMQLDQSHIQAPCTRPQFAANQCPAASIIGTAVATSPLVDYQLSGPVYLRTGDNPLPDIVLALKGPASQPIEIDTVGKIDTVNARLRTTIATIPDAPVTRAVISLVGGHKGLLVNNTNLCTHKDIAGVQLTGQNNKTADSNPKVAVKCPHKKHKKKKHHKKHKRHHRRAHRRAVR